MRDLFNKTAVQLPVSEVEHLHFPLEDVLFSEVERQERAKVLFLQADGFGVKQAEITFEDLTGLKTTVGILMDVTSEAVYLDEYVKIPINRIHAFQTLIPITKQH